MEGIPNIGGVPSSPVHGADPVGRVKPRSRRGEDPKRFEDELEDEGADPKADDGEQTPRREPHPPADEDSGNQLDVVA